MIDTFMVGLRSGHEPNRVRGRESNKPPGASPEWTRAARMKARKPNAGAPASIIELRRYPVGAATSVAPMLSVRFRERPADPTATELVKVYGRRPSQVEREGLEGRRTETSQARTRGGTGLTLWGFENSGRAVQVAR